MEKTLRGMKQKLIKILKDILDWLNESEDTDEKTNELIEELMKFAEEERAKKYNRKDCCI